MLIITDSVGHPVKNCPKMMWNTGEHYSVSDIICIDCVTHDSNYWETLRLLHYLRDNQKCLIASIEMKR